MVVCLGSSNILKVQMHKTALFSDVAAFVRKPALVICFCFLVKHSSDGKFPTDVSQSIYFSQASSFGLFFIPLHKHEKSAWFSDKIIIPRFQCLARITLLRGLVFKAAPPFRSASRTLSWR